MASNSPPWDDGVGDQVHVPGANGEAQRDLTGRSKLEIFREYFRLLERENGRQIRQKYLHPSFPAHSVLEGDLCIFW